LASAGQDIKIILPTNSVTINGTGNDTDGSINSFTWKKLTGPATFTLENANTPSLTVKDLIVGTYVFQLSVQDNDGANGVDEVTVMVSPKINLPPIVSAGPDIEVQLPVSQVTINGTVSDPDGTIKSSTWIQLSGSPVTLTITGSVLEVSDLTQGSYSFKLSATDDGDITSSDDVIVVVKANDFKLSSKPKKFITPNGDGQNDFWELDKDITKFATCKLVILKNDGSKVLETIGYKNDWNGIFNGQVLPQDVYYYVLECEGVKDSGSITILR
jgi:gliding motility-associated-like protein